MMPSQSSDSAKAVDGDFEIIGEGTVINCYLIDGKEKKITYTCAIHILNLNASLIFISTFDRASLTVTFGEGCSVVHKEDNTVILTGRCEKGMYIVDELDNALPEVPSTPITMTSLLQPASLKQGHH